MRRAESSLATQTRSKRNRLCWNFTKKKIALRPKTEVPVRQRPFNGKARNFTLLHNEREALKWDLAISSLNYRLMVNTLSSLRLATGWLLRQGRLMQFSLALETFYKKTVDSVEYHRLRCALLCFVLFFFCPHELSGHPPAPHMRSCSSHYHRLWLTWLKSTVSLNFW